MSTELPTFGNNSSSSTEVAPPKFELVAKIPVATEGLSEFRNARDGGAPTTPPESTGAEFPGSVPLCNACCDAEGIGLDEKESCDEESGDVPAACPAVTGASEGAVTWAISAAPGLSNCITAPLPDMAPSIPVANAFNP